MLESYFIYSVILLLLLVGSYADQQTRHISGWVSVLICSIILGFRYNVGIDYPTYLEYYKQFLYFGAKIGTSREYGYDLLNYLCAWLGCCPGMFFTLTVFVQLSLIYLTFRNQTKILPLVFFFYMTTGQLFGSLNIIRQAIAFSIFLYIIKYIKQKEFIKYLIGVVIAVSFHTSSLILIPIYWLPEIWSITFERVNEKWQTIIYIVIVLFSSSIFSIFLSSFSYLLADTVYFNYVPNLGERRMAVHSGMGIILFSIIDILIIIFSTPILSKYPNAKIYYIIFYIGALLSKIFGTDMLLSRVAYDLVSLRFIMLALLVLALDSRKIPYYFYIRMIIIAALISVWLFDIYNGSSGCSPYNFI